jgi:NTP pyrophosphatase (non-canonical NTP hydrolase)
MEQNKIKEALIITQEECAEVIQAISKFMRFGPDSRWPTEDSGSTTECLTMEVGQLLCMINILILQGIIDEEAMITAMEHKKIKLETWSNLYK